MTQWGESGPPASSSSIAAPTSSASRRHTLGTMVSLRVWTWGTSLSHATLITKTATVSGCTFNTAHPGVQVAYHEIIGTLLDYRPMRSGAWPKVAADFFYTQSMQEIFSPVTDGLSMQEIIITPPHTRYSRGVSRWGVLRCEKPSRQMQIYRCRQPRATICLQC